MSDIATDDFASYLEFDAIPRSTEPVEPTPEIVEPEPEPLDLDAAPTEPAWLREARAAIAGAQTRAQLNEICVPFRALTAAQRALIRPLRDARWDALGVTPARGVAVVTATAAMVATPAPAMAPVETAQIDSTPTTAARPLLATYSQIKTGPLAGQWGIRIELLQHGVAILPPVRGDVALVSRKHAAAHPRVIASVIHASDHRVIYAVEKTTPAGAQASLVRPRTAPATVASSTPDTTPEPAVPAEAPAVDATLATIDAPLASDLAAIAVEATSNATVADLGAQSASAPSATATRRLGVGFSSWEGYAEALRRGGLQPHTRAEYLGHVRGHMTEEEINALPPANAPSALPVGPGIVHMPTGPSIFSLPPAARRGALGVGRRAQEVSSGAALLRSGDLIAGAIAGGAGGDFSWAGRGRITRAALLATLAEIGREGDAPAAKNAHAQAGRAVTSLRGLGYHVHAVQGVERKGLPAHVSCRYIVGRAEVGDAATTAIGAEYGRRVLVVDLHQDDTLHCDGEAGAAARVKSDYEARCADDVYISADLTTWLQRTLRNVHHATRFGVGWYVPAGERDQAERLTRAVAKIWGESWRHGMPVAACSHLFEGLTEGLIEEIGKIEDEWAGAKEKAREANKLQIGTRAAAGLLARLVETAERVRGYAALLGDDAVAPLRTRLAALDGEIRPLCDDTSSRASMLEFS